MRWAGILLKEVGPERRRRAGEQWLNKRGKKERKGRKPVCDDQTWNTNKAKKILAVESY